MECRSERSSGAAIRIYTVVHQNQTKDQTGPLVFAEDLAPSGSEWNGSWFGPGQSVLLNEGDKLLLGGRSTTVIFSHADREPQEPEKQLQYDNELDMSLFRKEYDVQPRPIASMGRAFFFFAVRSHYRRQVSCRIVDLQHFRKTETQRLLDATKASTDEGVALQRQFAASGFRTPGAYYWDLVERKCRMFATVLEEEMKLLRGIRHPNILFLEKAGKSDKFLYIFQEFMTGNSLRTYLRRMGRLPEDEAAAIVLQVIKALQHLHGRGITHGNLRPDTIMIDMSVGHPRAVLMNFESARRSPAIDEDGVRDLWALGAIACLLLTGQVPFLVRQGSGMPDALALLRQSETISEVAKDFVQALLRPSNQVGAGEWGEHAWLRREPFRTEFEAAYARISTACRRDILPMAAVRPVVGRYTPQQVSTHDANPLLRVEGADMISSSGAGPVPQSPSSRMGWASTGRCSTDSTRGDRSRRVRCRQPATTGRRTASGAGSAGSLCSPRAARASLSASHRRRKRGSAERTRGRRGSTRTFGQTRPREPPMGKPQERRGSEGQKRPLVPK